LYGQQVTMAYYAQHQLEALNPAATILEELAAVTPQLTPQQRRTLLGAFLFSGDEVSKPIAVLSGGEKARVALAKLLARPANLLVMDEPTNHLDMLSRQVLEDALADYEGTLIFISHDRGFINAIANRIVEIREGKLRSFPGNYDDYLWRKEQEAAAAALPAAQLAHPTEARNQAPPEAVVRHKKEDRRARAERIQERSRRLKPLQEKLLALESEIAVLEKEKHDLTNALCDPAVMAEAALYPQKLKRHHEIECRLQESYNEWASLSEQIEAVQAAFAD
ncbi:MAG: ATP-binding cassette domain-containing protein, partial [candidate division KSB1 bacterium]|nr:ATP-binding cassette domain-containing protein [candidate division KSB1 bacterium]